MAEAAQGDPLPIEGEEAAEAAPSMDNQQLEAFQGSNNTGEPVADSGTDLAGLDNSYKEVEVYHLPASLDAKIEWEIPHGLEELYYSIFCSICQEYCTEELMPRCSEDHVICNNCTTMVLDSGSTECPMRCGSLLISQDQATRNTASRALQLFLRIPCPNRVYGCAELPRVAHAEEHTLLCDFRRKDCPYEYRGCREKVTDQWEHRQGCVFRPVKCKNMERGCPRDDVSYKNLKFHEKYCRHQWAPVGTEYAPQEGAGEENQGGPQQRWFQLKNFWIQRICTLDNWIGINDIFQISGTPTSQEDALERLLDSEYTWERRLEEEQQLIANRESEQMMIELEQRALQEAENQLLTAEDLLAEDPMGDDLLINEPITEEIMREMLEISDSEVESPEGQGNNAEATEMDQEASAPREDNTGSEDQPTEEQIEISAQEEEPQDENAIQPVEEGELISFEDEAADAANVAMEGEDDNLWNGATEPATNVQDLIAAIGNMNTNLTECMEEETFNNTMNTAEEQIAWAQAEWSRITERKVENYMQIRESAEYPGYGPRYCQLCSEASSPIFPNPGPIFHVHHSSRLAMLERINSGHVESFNCMSGCKYTDHLPKPDYRRKLLITSSTLKQWDTDAKDDPELGYLGNESHVDLLAIPGGTIEEICHALWLELEGSTEPVDIISVFGLNNCLNTLVMSENGVVGLNTVVRAIHCITGLLRKSKARNTIGFARIPKVPMLHLTNRGILVDRLNKVFRLTNVAMSTAWGTNAKYAPVFETWGLILPTERHRGTPVLIRRDWFREQVDTRMLHFTRRVKLEMGRDCLRFLQLSRGWASGPRAMSRA